MNKTFSLLPILLIVFSSIQAELGFTKDGGLDYEQISQIYFEGEFEKVKNILSKFKKENPNASRKDKIFVYKYLSVVYAADPNTKHKAESYMYQLVKMVPTIELIDLYISDNIQIMFDKIKARYNKEVSYNQQFDQFGDTKVQKQPEETENSTAPLNSEEQAAKPKKSKAWIPWTLGGVAVAGAVTAFVIISKNDSEPTTITHNLD